MSNNHTLIVKEAVVCDAEFSIADPLDFRVPYLILLYCCFYLRL